MKKQQEGGKGTMEEKTVISLNKDEIKEAFAEYLERKGYTMMDYQGIHTFEAEVKKI